MSKVKKEVETFNINVQAHSVISLYGDVEEVSGGIVIKHRPYRARKFVRKFIANNELVAFAAGKDGFVVYRDIISVKNLVGSIKEDNGYATVNTDNSIVKINAYNCNIVATRVVADPAKQKPKRAIKA